MIYLLPGLSALIYPFAAIFIKRAIGQGVGPWRSAFICNLAIGLVNLLPLLFIRTPFPAEALPFAACAALTFFLGQLFTFHALARGDVSLATPVLGTKVVFVALIIAVILREEISVPVKAAVLVTSLGVILLQWGRSVPGSHPVRTILQAISSAFFFAITDVMVQEYGSRYGVQWFVPMVFSLVALYSLPLVKLFSRPLSHTSVPARRALFFGAFLLAVQAAVLAFALASFGNATIQNVIYNSRGLWSVLLIWFFGARLGSTDSNPDGFTMVRRMIGAILILSAIGLVLAA